MEKTEQDKIFAIAKNMLNDGSEFMFLSPDRVVMLLEKIKELEAKIKELENVLRS